jgi:predicted dehydrogenase
VGNRLTASVVGGGSGGRLSLTALRASERFDLIAVADISPQAREALAHEYGGIATFATHDEMFAACPTDVVCVSTWPPSHEHITMAALELPLKGILVEKPLGHTHASGARILEAIKRRNLPMAVPHGLIAMRAPLDIVSRVQRGEIGDLRLMEIQCSHWDIINAGIHWLQFFVTLTGREPMDHVMAVCDTSTRTYRDGMQVETTAVTYARTRSGIRVVMQTGDDVVVDRAGQLALFRIVGTRGLIEYCPWASEYLLVNAGSPGGTTISLERLAGTHHQRRLDHLAGMIESGERDYTIAENSLAALEIVEGAYISSRHSCKVTFPLEQYEPPAASDWDPGRPYGGTGGGRDGRRL